MAAAWPSMCLPKYKVARLDRFSNDQLRVLASMEGMDMAAVPRAGLLSAVSNRLDETAGLNWTLKVLEVSLWYSVTAS